MKTTPALILFLLLQSGISFGQKRIVKTPSDSLRYLALGDSYTAGYLVPKQQSLPYQLVRRLAANGFKTARPEVIAHNGWNTRQLLDTLSRKKPTGNFDIVTLFIGVNNQYRGYTLPDYESDMTQLVKDCVRYAGKNKAHVLIIGIPDWSITPFGADKNPQQMALEIADFNTINKKVSEKMGVKFIDMFSISRKMKEDPEAVASDKLHPTEKTYAIWADYIFQNMKSSLVINDK